jgi:hypothetical protein
MMRTRLTLRPGDPGTRRHVERYGERLVCVRYRYDEERQIRITTVELEVDRSPWTPPAKESPDDAVWVRIRVEEVEHRRRLKSVGAQFDAQRCCWRTQRHLAHTLGLSDRIVGPA